jgi:hypothetical protein
MSLPLCLCASVVHLSFDVPAQFTSRDCLRACAAIGAGFAASGLACDFAVGRTLGAAAGYALLIAATATAAVTCLSQGAGVDARLCAAPCNEDSGQGSERGHQNIATFHENLLNKCERIYDLERRNDLRFFCVGLYSSKHKPRSRSIVTQGSATR